ncbi:Retrovirus-related Pol polyprotein from type-2 retrotransposable element R2DM [Frankliniella fusca]|uniref:Retrovirus-related Pol polyprotein from type-2 retrotransposable element R2DM n=1 Tax=Frankliniella fusca TaxID=407009 RepID=A0AAE1I0L9_9NEOP|nr:Retrovirus-related Pol polyprotein from type-2 retrotransposable element R2DM [Frankliniella fusca]
MRFSVVGVHVPCDTSPRQAGVLASVAAVVAYLPRDSWRVVLSDWKAHIGRRDTPPSTQVGPRLHHQDSSMAGIALVELAQQAGLPIIRTGLKALGPQAGGPPPQRQCQQKHRWAIRALNEQPGLQDKYREAVGLALDTATNLRHLPLTWDQLTEVLITAANAFLPLSASPVTPRHQAAHNLLRAAQTAVARTPGDAFAEDLLLRANTAQGTAGNPHAVEKRARLFSAVQDVHPAARLNAVFLHLRGARRGARGVTPCPYYILPELVDPNSPSPTARQLRGYAASLSRNTAVGPDGLPSELFQYVPDALFVTLEAIIRVHWESGDNPQDLGHVVDRPRTTADFRTLPMGSVITKLLAKHLLFLLQECLPRTPWYQAGFQRDRGTYDHIFVVRRVLDERWRAGDRMFLLALDIKGAFPSTLQPELAAILLAEGATPYLVNRVTKIALTDFSSVRWFAARTREVRTVRGVKQGCPLAPWLFTRALHWAVGVVERRCPRFSLELATPAFAPIVCCYADDLLVVSPRRADLDDFMSEFIPAIAAIGLTLNLTKCITLKKKNQSKIL